MTYRAHLLIGIVTTNPLYCTNTFLRLQSPLTLLQWTLKVPYRIFIFHFPLKRKSRLRLIV